MGREIRKVPRGWEHPRDDRGRYRPMFAEPYVDVLREWQRNNELWEKGIHPDQQRYPEATGNCRRYADWTSDAPDALFYNPNKWTENEACCFQVYETVTEGTPVSPVFDSLPALAEWLVKTQGCTKEHAEEFCSLGWQPTFTVTFHDNPNIDKKGRAPEPIPKLKARKSKGKGRRP